MKIYVKASKQLATAQEKALCRFMRDNYGLDASINTNNNVCNLSLDRIACVVVSDEYDNIAWENWKGESADTKVHSLGTLCIPYDTPLNGATANTIIELLTYSDEEKQIIQDNETRINNLKQTSKQISEGRYVTQRIKKKLGLLPDDKFLGKPRFSETRINKYIYYDSSRYNDIKNICEEIDSEITNKYNRSWFTGNIECKLDNNKVIVIVDMPFKLLINPKTLEIIEVMF